MITRDKHAAPIYVLIGLAAILAIALILRAWHGSQAVSILRTAPRNMALPAMPGALEVPADLKIIQDRALFYASRSFYAPALATRPTALSQLSTYRLLGTLLVPRRPAVAFLRKSAAGKTLSLSPGDQLDGWTVLAVKSGKAVFGYEHQRTTLSTPKALGNLAEPNHEGTVH